MESGKVKLLIWVLLLLAAACTPHQATHNSLKDLLPGQDQCHQMVRKQRQLARKNSLPALRSYQARTGPAASAAPGTPFQDRPQILLAAAQPSHIGSIPEAIFISGLRPNYPLPDFSGAAVPAPQEPPKNLAVPRPIIQKPISVSPAPLVAGEAEDLPVKIKASLPKALTGNHWLPALFGLSGLLGILMFLLTPARFRRLSGWAAENPWKTRAILTGSHTAVFFGSLALGNYFSDLGLFMSEASRTTGLVVFGATALLYPVSHPRFRPLKPSYLHQKVKDVLLFTSGAFLLLHFTNHHSIIRQAGPPVTQAAFSFKSVLEPGKTVSIVPKKLLEKDVTDNKPAKKEPLAITILKIFLVLNALFLIGALIASLACSLACSGMEGAAILLLAIGIPGVITLAVLLIRNIIRNARRKAAEARAASAVPLPGN